MYELRINSPLWSEERVELHINKEQAEKHKLMYEQNGLNVYKREVTE